MPTPIFTIDGIAELPWIQVGWRDDLPVMLLRDGGPEEVVAEQLAPLAARRWRWPFEMSAPQRQAVDAFLVQARKLGTEAFYILDPHDAQRTAIALGTGNGAQVIWPLPSTLASEYRRDFPVDEAATLLKVNGVSVTRTVQVDARTLTAAVAPGVGTTVTADYRAYRKVRIASPIDWSGVTAVWVGAELELVECLDGA